LTGTILQAAKTHDVLIWFCGLSSSDLHVARIKARVAAGGHPIPEEKIRERYPSAQLNLVISPAPDDLDALQRAPEWSKSFLEAALRAGPA